MKGEKSIGQLSDYKFMKQDSIAWS